MLLPWRRLGGTAGFVLMLLLFELFVVVAIVLFIVGVLFGELFSIS